MNEMFHYKIINYWNDSDDLYVNYEVENLNTNQKANTIEYFNVSDIGCDYNNSSYIEIKNSLLKLLRKNNGIEFNKPKVSQLSPLLKNIYDTVCESESNMYHVDNEDWEELKEDCGFTNEDIIILKKEINKYNLADVLTIDSDNYKICGYGCLQTMFNDDREKGMNEFER